MKSFCRRAFIRNDMNTPVLYAQYNTNRYHHGTMRNSSVGGMYLETERELIPGTDIFIKLMDFQPDPYWPEYTDAYRAEVIWSQSVKNGDRKPKFGVGVRYIVNCCDQCGDTIPYDAIEKNHDHMILCGDCSAQLSLLTGTMKKSIEHYLVGNVV